MRGLPGSRFAAPTFHYHAAAPAAAPAFSFTVGLWMLVSLLVAIGLKAGWDESLGKLLRGLGAAANVGVWKVKINAGGAFYKLDDVVQASLGAYILANEKAVGLWWHTNKEIASFLGDSIAGFGEAVHETIGNLVDGTIPATVGAHTKPLRDGQRHAQRTFDLRARAEVNARVKADKAQAADLDATFGRARAGIDNIGAKARAYTDAKVGRVQGQIAAERRYAHRVLNKRLTLLEKALGVGAIGGIAIASLTRVFPYWQCTNFRRFSRLICRSPLGALDDLLGLALVLVGSISIVTLARELQGVTAFSARAVSDWVIED